MANRGVLGGTWNEEKKKERKVDEWTTKKGKKKEIYLMCDIRSRIRNISAHLRQNALMIIAVQQRILGFTTVLSSSSNGTSMSLDTFAATPRDFVYFQTSLF